MTDEDPHIDDDKLAALLRRVGDDSTLRPQHRERSRAAMFAEFDATVADADGVDSAERLSVVPTIEVEEERHRSARGSSVVRWTAAAAACSVLTLIVVANLRDDSATSDTVDRPLPTPFETLPGVEDPLEQLTAASVPLLLNDATYRTGVIRDGLAFASADGLQLVALRPGLMVLDVVSNAGDLRSRVSVFEADQAGVDEVIGAAVDNGYLQLSEARFTDGDQSLRRQDLTVTGEGIADLGCVGQDGCLPLVDGADEFDPSVWARSENFLVEASPGNPSIFVFVQTKTFGDPLLGQAFEIIDSFEFD